MIYSGTGTTVPDKALAMADATPLDPEIAQIEADIRANPDPRTVRLEQLLRMRKEYRALPSVVRALTTPPDPATVPTGNGQQAPARQPGRRRSPERERAL